ncbi:MAG TPA: hypothetical protein VMG41_09895 [Gemmatimonadales bacterium]|nr:hypothetical protein [Gemmatimonadales bacterium]
MDASQVRDLATELETTLRLLAQLVTELESRREDWNRSGVVRELVTRLAGQPNLVELPAILLRAHAEITEVLGGIRLTREAIECNAIERIRDTKDQISDVASTTESATLELMNGLDRSLELINSLESQAHGAAPAEGYQELRSQLSALYNHLQFQDITTQQLQGVAQSLLDVERRVAAVAALFDRAFHAQGTLPLESASGAASSAHLAFNPDATMKRTPADQATVDLAFKGARGDAASPCDARP